MAARVVPSVRTTVYHNGTMLWKQKCLSARIDLHPRLYIKRMGKGRNKYCKHGAITWITSTVGAPKLQCRGNSEHKRDKLRVCAWSFSDVASLLIKKGRFGALFHNRRAGNQHYKSAIPSQPAKHRNHGVALASPLHHISAATAQRCGVSRRWRARVISRHCTKTYWYILQLTDWRLLLLR